MPRFHPGDELLLDYAAGSLSEAVSLLIATHLSLCPECRRRVRLLEMLGGSLLSGMAGAKVHCTAESVLRQAARPLPASPASSAGQDPGIPRPLRDYLPAPLAAIAWRAVTRSLGEVEVPVGSSAERARLLRVAAGAAIPRHTHLGIEYVMVLAGGFADVNGCYRRGDVLVADRALDHSPTAFAGEDCLCLAVLDGKIELTGRFGWLFNRLLKKKWLLGLRSDSILLP